MDLLCRSRLSTYLDRTSCLSRIRARQQEQLDDDGSSRGSELLDHQAHVQRESRRGLCLDEDARDDGGDDDQKRFARDGAGATVLLSWATPREGAASLRG